jgi:hypothetical protein
MVAMLGAEAPSIKRLHLWSASALPRFFTEQ